MTDTNVVASRGNLTLGSTNSFNDFDPSLGTLNSISVTLPGDGTFTSA